MWAEQGNRQARKELTVRQHHGEMHLHVLDAPSAERDLVRSHIHGIDDFLARRRHGPYFGRGVGTPCKGFVELSHEDSEVPLLS